MVNKRIRIDFSDVQSSEALHELLAEQLGFPDYYGKNWDAFWDCITDPGQSQMPPNLEIHGWHSLSERLPHDADLMRQCLIDLASEQDDVQIEWEIVNMHTKTHCCEDMQWEAERSCDQHPNRFDCPDCLIHYSPKFREYGLIIHNGGSAFSVIQFCPWCGSQLPAPLRAQWFDEMERLGIDPWEGEIPVEFQTETWWKDNYA